MASQYNSKITRVQPVFDYLDRLSEKAWPQRLLSIARGLSAEMPNCGEHVRTYLVPEKKVPPTRERLIWMLANLDQLAPTGERYNEFQNRTSDRQRVAEAIQALRDGRSISRKLVFEGNTHSDCIIECEKMIIWIEGKRFDWISSRTTWDAVRDQISRNLEAASILAAQPKKSYCLLICHEFPLKLHESALIDGYRAGTWSAGWPHISSSARVEFAQRIGTITWGSIVSEWPELKDIPVLGDCKPEPA